MNVEQILAEVARRPAADGVRVIGVDGPAGAGKSTLARSLAEASDAALIEIDDFTSWDDPTGVHWWPRFEEQVLQPLRRGDDPRFQQRDWINDWRGNSLGGWKTVAWRPLVVIEGVTCTRLAAAGLLAYAIWVEAPDDVRLSRGLARDHALAEDVAALWRVWMAAERRFFEADGTRERADLIVKTA